MLGLDAATAATISVADLRTALDRDEVAVVDLDTSLRYRDGHIPGAWWAVRARLRDRPAEAAGRKAARASPRPTARWRGSRRARPALTAKALAGGTRAWRDAGLPLEKGDERLADAPDDVWYKPYDHGTAVEGAMRAYLTWEVGLVPQIERDGDARFKVLAPAVGLLSLKRRTRPKRGAESRRRY